LRARRVGVRRQLLLHSLELPLEARLSLGGLGLQRSKIALRLDQRRLAAVQLRPRASQGSLLALERSPQRLRRRVPRALLEGSPLPLEGGFAVLQLLSQLDDVALLNTRDGVSGGGVGRVAAR